jgi:glycosyltransferase
MKLSVVTPVYNEPRVARALDSILSQQAHFSIEPIVIDGGSTDQTLKVLSSYRSRLAVFISEPDRGIYDAMNKGVARATGDVVGILNSDDRYADNRVLERVAEVLQDPTIDACYGNLVYVDGRDRVIRYWRAGRYRPSSYHLGWMPPHPTFFVRRSAYARYGTFDTSFPIAADYELMLRLMVRYRIKVRYIDAVLVRMAAGGNSGRSPWTVVRAGVEVFRSWRKNRLAYGYFAPVLKPGRKIAQYVVRERA